MTEEEIETVANELAKVGGASWYPGRSRGSFLRVVSQRYRDRARVAIAALDRYRSSSERGTPLPPTPEVETMGEDGSPRFDDQVKVGSIVMYRPPNDQRAIRCRVEKLEDGRAYLVPCPQPDIGWVPLDGFSLNAAGDDSA